MTSAETHALEWYQDMGVDCVTLTEPNNRFESKVDLSAFQETPTPKVKQVSDKPQKQITPPADIDLSTCTDLDSLRTTIESHTDYPFKKTATNLVFGDGNPEADIMVIGDAPTRDEDRSGKAFDGLHGALMDKMLDAIGLSRETTYLSHIMHYPTPGNRTPTPEHLSNAKPFIEKQIELIAPKFLILMGSDAPKTLLNTDKSLSRMRGEWFDYGSQKIPTLVTYTPEFLLNNPLQKRKVWQDLLALKGKINE